MREYKDFVPETNALIRGLQRAGLTIEHVVVDGDKTNFKGTPLDLFVHECMATEDCLLYVSRGRRTPMFIYLVYGNCPGELPCDYAARESEDGKLLDKAIGEHYDRWSQRVQPRLIETEYDQRAEAMRQKVLAHQAKSD